MEITSIRMKKNAHNEGAVLAVASVELDNCLIIHNIKILDIKGKRVVSFPNRKVKKYTVENGEYTENFEYTDMVHPSNREFREYFEKELFKIYDTESEE